MNNIFFKKLIENENWNSKDLPNYLKIDDVKLNLNKIVDINSNQDSNLIGEEILNSIGSNHRGVYFPIVEDVIDLLITILENSQDNSKRKLLVLGLLNDLYYFDLDNSFKNDPQFLNKSISIRKKLEKYSDENFPNLLK